MEYVRLGHSGLKVSRLCLGCMTYGSSRWREWVLDEPESRPFIQKAVEAGINFFDTADMYSMGASEEVLGRAIRDFARREEIVVATASSGRRTAGGGRGPKPDHVEQCCFTLTNHQPRTTL